MKMYRKGYNYSKEDKGIENYRDVVNRIRIK